MEITLKVRSYIGDPYHPAKQQLVDLQKKSGMNRVRSEDKRDQSLLRYLEKIGKSMEDYHQLEKEAAAPWYRDHEGKIMIPRHHFSGCLVQASSSAPAGARFDKDQLRSMLQIGDFHTNKLKCDTIFSRFVKPTDGKGNPLSNMRSLRENEVIENFEAVGTIYFDDGDVKEKSVIDLLRYAGKYIGVGASRKMGYGRFSIVATD